MVSLEGQSENHSALEEEEATESGDTPQGSLNWSGFSEQDPFVQKLAMTKSCRVHSLGLGAETGVIPGVKMAVKHLWKERERGHGHHGDESFYKFGCEEEEEKGWSWRHMWS